MIFFFDLLTYYNPFTVCDRRHLKKLGKSLKQQSKVGYTFISKNANLRQRKFITRRIKK